MLVLLRKHDRTLPVLIFSSLLYSLMLPSSSNTNNAEYFSLNSGSVLALLLAYGSGRLKASEEKEGILSHPK